MSDSSNSSSATVKGAEPGFPPVIIGHGELREPVVVKFSVYQGRKRVSIRFHYEGPTNHLNPAKRGVEVPIARLGELIEALKEVRNQIEEAGGEDPIPF